MKILEKVKNIPSDSIVKKIGGTKPYNLRRTVIIYKEDGNRTTIECEDGEAFLINGNGDINVVGGEKEMVWEVESRVLVNYIEEGDM